jgi:hypothetical protein
LVKKKEGGMNIVIFGLKKKREGEKPYPTRQQNMSGNTFYHPKNKKCINRNTWKLSVLLTVNMAIKYLLLTIFQHEATTDENNIE